jgi:phosphate/sulfate permease
MMTDIEPIWWLRIFMIALLLGMGIFGWCEISKARTIKRYYDSRRKAFDAQLAAAILTVAAHSNEKPKEEKNSDE